MFHLETLIPDITEAFFPLSRRKLKKLESLKQKEYYELVDYVYSIIKDMPIFSPLPPYMVWHRKSNNHSDECRKLGNEFFVKKYAFIPAVEFYSKAVADAELGSENLCLAYSNRSHALYTYGYFNACLKDIDRALQCNCSENLKEKLLKRKRNAEEIRHIHQNTELYHQAVPEIKNKSDLIESASNSLELKTEGGSHKVIARRNIKFGDVLIVETPYISQVELLNKYQHCNFCMELCYNMIACDVCTEALYCDEDCRKEAFEQYHKYECILLKYGLNKKSISLRLTIKAILEYNQLVQDLSNDDDPYFKSNRYKEIYRMKFYKQLTHPGELFEDALEPAIFYHYLTKYTDILDNLNVEHKDRVLKNLLFRNHRITQLRQVYVEKLKECTFLNSVTDVVGSAVYSFFSQFNHSCFPNALSYFYGNKIVVRAAANIKKGDEITTNSGFTFMDTVKSERQEKLLKRYGTVCQCEACLKNWPTSDQLKLGAPIPQKFLNKVRNLYEYMYGPWTEDEVNKLLDEGITHFNNLKINEVPTQNYITLRDVLFDLYYFLANKTIDE